MVKKKKSYKQRKKTLILLAEDSKHTSHHFDEDLQKRSDTTVHPNHMYLFIFHARVQPSLQKLDISHDALVHT